MSKPIYTTTITGAILYGHIFQMEDGRRFEYVSTYTTPPEINGVQYKYTAFATPNAAKEFNDKGRRFYSH